MTDLHHTTAGMEIQPRPSMELGLYLKQQRFGQAGTKHQRFAPAALPHPNWISFASQRHMRSMAIDTVRGRVWLGTWGGVLCWIPATGECIRHTTEHGLVGNATRCLAVDMAGVVWTCSQGGELCSLAPDWNAGWHHHVDLGGWKAQHLVTRPEGGIYAVLRDTSGRGALGTVDSPGAPLKRRLEGNLACTDVEALLAEEAGALWLGNAWGLYYYPGHGDPDYLDLSVDEKGRKGVRVRVRTLASGADGELWVGTNWGLYRLYRDRRTHAPAIRELRDEVSSLAWNPEMGHLWVATSATVGRMVDDTWQPLRLPPPGKQFTLLCGQVGGMRHIWAAGTNGLYELGADKAVVALDPSPEDALSNAVHDLWADGSGVWVGTARGLYQFDGETWSEPTCLESDLGGPTKWDVQAIVPGTSKDQLWVGAGRSGLRHLQQGVDVPILSPAAHIVALAIGFDGSTWAATPDAIYWHPLDSSQWQRRAISGRSIQALCHQMIAEGNGKLVGTLWVGTSRGLFSYRPELDQLAPAPDALQRLSIRALTLDPLTQQLWVGTSKGLFSALNWQCYHKEVTDVRALTFSPPPDGTLWVGTANGLERWPAPGREALGDQPAERFTAADSGLAADLVTALTVRTCRNKFEVWAGSPTGVSCYQHS